MSRESKFLSRVLRHEPELIDITLDPEGWVRVDVLLRNLKKAGRGMSRAELETLVATDAKSRFTLRGSRIRAAQGHSVSIDLGLTPKQPPETLYHGTASQSLDAIFARGLNPGRRRHVHLSPDPGTATLVGQRHGKAVVLSVDAAQMHADGHTFYKADNGVWLTDLVPPRYLGFNVIE